MSNLFDIAIITYKSDELLKRCVQSILQQSIGPENLWVVATGKSAPAIDGVSVLHAPNHSYAQAVNLAFEQSTNSLLLLNDDTRLTQDCLAELCRHHSDRAVLQPQITLLDRPDVVENCGHWIGRDASNTARHRGQPKQQQSPEEIPCFSGAAVWLPYNVRQKIGIFDPSLSPFGEDVDYAIRCRRAGFQIKCVYSAIIEHKLGHSYGLSSRQKIAWVEEHRLRILWRHFPPQHQLSLLWTLKRYRWMAQGVQRYPKLTRKNALVGIISGWCNALQSLPAELKKRREYQLAFVSTENGFINDVNRGVHRAEVQHPSIETRKG